MVLVLYFMVTDLLDSVTCMNIWSWRCIGHGTRKGLMGCVNHRHETAQQILKLSSFQNHLLEFFTVTNMIRNP